MYYEEKWIDGWLHWRGSPTSEWVKADAEKLNARLYEEMFERKDEALWRSSYA